MFCLAFFDGIFLLFVFRIDEVDISQFSIIVELWILNSPPLLFLFVLLSTCQSKSQASTVCVQRT